MRQTQNRTKTRLSYWEAGAQLDIWLVGGQGEIFSAQREILLLAPLNIFRGGEGQEKCVLYLNNNKLILQTGYSV